MTEVRIPISTELLQQMLRLPDTATIRTVEPHERPGAVYVIADVPEGAVVMIPTYERSYGWPDPLHIREVDWVDATGVPIELPTPKEVPRG